MRESMPLVPILLAAACLSSCEAMDKFNKTAGDTIANYNELTGNPGTSGGSSPATTPGQTGQPVSASSPVVVPSTTLKLDTPHNNSPNPNNPIPLLAPLSLEGELMKQSDDSTDYYAFKPKVSGQVAISISNTTKNNPQSRVWAEIQLDGQRLSVAGHAAPDREAPPNAKPTVYPDRLYYVKVASQGGYSSYTVNLQLVPN